MESALALVGKMNVRIGSVVRPNGLLILCKKGSVYYFLIVNPNRLMRRKWTFFSFVAVQPLTV